MSRAPLRSVSPDASASLAPSANEATPLSLSDPSAHPPAHPSANSLANCSLPPSGPLIFHGHSSYPGNIPGIYIPGNIVALGLGLTLLGLPAIFWFSVQTYRWQRRLKFRRQVALLEYLWRRSDNGVS